MKIALAQTNIVWEDKTENYKIAENIIGVAALEKTRLILFPEMSFTGFSMNTVATKENSPNMTVLYIEDMAKKYGISIGFGWVKDCGERSENHYTVINDKGEIISDYAKMHPFSYSGEDKKFVGGRNVVKFEIDNVWFSNFICYDLRFPEIFQAVSDEVSVIVVPANWPEKRRGHWKTLLKARAIENQVYIMAINCFGEIGNQFYAGDSCVINPNGDIEEILSYKEGIIYYNFEDDVKSYREEFPMRKDRRQSLYSNLLLKKQEQ